MKWDKNDYLTSRSGSINCEISPLLGDEYLAIVYWAKDWQEPIQLYREKHPTLDKAKAAIWEFVGKIQQAADELLAAEPEINYRKILRVYMQRALVQMAEEL